MMCQVCKGIPPEVEGPIEIVVADRPKSPLPTMEFPVSVDLMRVDLYELLQPSMWGYSVGAVRLHGATCEDYVSVYASNEVRVRRYGRTKSEYAPCRGCGRVYQQLVDSPSCVRTAEIESLQVFTSVGGTGVYLRYELLATMNQALRQELKIIKIPVCDEKD
jgi:hypothetical protein